MTEPSGAFFDAVRPLFGGALSQGQVDGMKIIIDGFRQFGDGSVTKLAYILATVFHETARTMQPVKETQFGADAPTDAQVKARLTKAWKAGKLPWVKRDYWSGGFFGRGYVQLTHEANYARAGRELGIDLVADPDKALEPEIAVRVLIEGMMEGWFTSKKLGDYITNSAFDFEAARRVVNGTDRAGEIAGYAMSFLNGIRALQKAQERPAEPDPAPQPAPMPAEPETPASDEPIAEREGFQPDWGKIAVAIGIIAAVVAALSFFF